MALINKLEFPSLVFCLQSIYVVCLFRCEEQPFCAHAVSFTRLINVRGGWGNLVEEFACTVK